MASEPDTDRHHIFETFTEAMTAWMLLPDDTEITPPRQSHDCWIIDREVH
jgi:hypothetical protein